MTGQTSHCVGVPEIVSKERTALVKFKVESRGETILIGDVSVYFRVNNNVVRYLISICLPWVNK